LQTETVDCSVEYTPICGRVSEKLPQISAVSEGVQSNKGCNEFDSCVKSQINVVAS